jgi:hypothetical protein
MIIFKDMFTDAEMISDSYDLKEVDGVIYEANGAMITIGAVNADIGANASAEEADEGTEDADQKVMDIVHSFQLQKLEGFTKADYKALIMKYMKAVSKQLEANGKPKEDIEAFQKAAPAKVKEILKNFDDYELYHGEGGGDHIGEGKAMLALLNYREDGITPYFSFWKHGLTEMKV